MADFDGERGRENGHVDGTVPWARRKGRDEIFHFSEPVIEYFVAALRAQLHLILRSIRHRCSHEITDQRLP